jgi:hypothetical protein
MMLASCFIGPPKEQVIYKIQAGDLFNLSMDSPRALLEG